MTSFTDSITIFAIDFGTSEKLAIHGDGVSMTLSSLKLAPSVKPGDDFPRVLAALSKLGKRVWVVFESSTVGSSGAERADVEMVLADCPNLSLWVISGRAVKNYYKEHRTKDEDKTDSLAASVIYWIATNQPKRLKRWGQSSPVERIHTSVRPMDKRGYADERAEEFMSLLPPFDRLPRHLRELLGKDGDYCRSMVMPFAMALTEPYYVDGPKEGRRRRFEKIIGSYDHGYPSFYRRMFIDWMQDNAKRIASVRKIEDVSRDQRKRALQMTQRWIRQLLYLAEGWMEQGEAFAFPKDPEEQPPTPRRLR